MSDILVYTRERGYFDVHPDGRVEGAEVGREGLDLSDIRDPRLLALASSGDAAALGPDWKQQEGVFVQGPQTVRLDRKRKSIEIETRTVEGDRHTVQAEYVLGSPTQGESVTAPSPYVSGSPTQGVFPPLPYEGLQPALLEETITEDYQPA